MSDINKHNQDVVLLDILSAIERDPEVTQRSVASEVGIALGLVNTYLRRCITKGLVKVRQAPAKRYAYYLTPRGLVEKSRLTASYLSTSFSFFRRARTQCASLMQTASARGHRKLVLVGKSDLGDIARLVSLEADVVILGDIDAPADLASLRSRLNNFEECNALVVVDLASPSRVAWLCEDAIGYDRVYVPELLRVRKRQVQVQQWSTE